MSRIYSLLDIILPFEWLGYEFMKNAFLAVLLITPIFGILSTIIVNNRMAFFSDALGHGAFTGIAIGTVVGIIQPVWSAVFFSIGFAVLITIIKNKTKTSTDTVIGVFSSAAIALGVVLVTSGGNGAKYTSVLVGDLLSISAKEIGMLLILAIIILVLWIVFYNKVLLVSLNLSLAKSRGINTLGVELAFTSLIAVVVTISLQWVGLLIINSLLVLPAAGARNVATNSKQYNIITLSISILSGISGLILSYYLDTATGATIVMVSAVIYFITLVLRKRFL